MPYVGFFFVVEDVFFFPVVCFAAGVLVPTVDFTAGVFAQAAGFTAGVF